MTWLRAWLQRRRNGALVAAQEAATRECEAKLREQAKLRNAEKETAWIRAQAPKLAQLPAEDLAVRLLHAMTRRA